MSVVNVQDLPATGKSPWSGRLGDSEMAERVRAFDWSATPLGAIAEWPTSLRSAIAICLHSRFQMAIYWGPELNCIYNDAERDVLGALHPGALGLPAQELLRDAWNVVGPQLQGVIEHGDATWAEDQPLSFDRRGVLETGYFTYSYSPIPDEDGGVGGVLLVTQETTARVLKELRAAQRRIAAAGDAERRRIERNLHDGAQQRLVAIRLELGLLSEHLEREPSTAQEELHRLGRELDEALEELRELAHGLYPPLLASDGLPAAVSAAARRAAIPIEVDAPDFGRLPSAIEGAAYFCCLEALQNATKHAGDGARGSVRLRVRDGFLQFKVSDDGVGFDRDRASDGDGLINVADRLEALGGEVEITSAPGMGTTIAAQIPLT